MSKVQSVLPLPNYTNILPFEHDFNQIEAKLWMETNWTTSFFYVGAYLIFLYVGGQYMAKRPRFELKWPLIFWNLGLALFSIFGTFRTFPELVHVLKQSNGFYHSVCTPSWGENHVVQFWTFLFVTSKAFELIDTVFIILRKQKLIFLHYYHHITVLVYAWYTHAEFIAPTRWFVSINFAIHALMYSYYGLKALKVNIPKPIAVAITSLQIVQMIIGMTVNLTALMTKMNGEFCHVSKTNIGLSLFMYSSYFVLFGHFFYKAYLVKPNKSSGAKIQKGKRD